MGNFVACAKKCKMLTEIYRFVYRIIATIYWNLLFIGKRLTGSKDVYACCFVFTDMLGRIKKNNWGDDLNVYLFPLLTGQKIRFVPFDRLFFSPKLDRYSLIGSILGDYSLNHTIIYGSGAISSNAKLEGKPMKVLSVRGPLSRDVLLRNGIGCPSVYGDPALLLPLVYKPQIQPGNFIGVIPHYRTSESAVSNYLSLWQKYGSVKHIDMSQYEKWTDVIDSILQCKIIVSESLHGLILAEGYGIPSVWVEFVPHHLPWEWEFKFLDFYQSIGKNSPKCYKLYNADETDNILDKAGIWKPGVIDYDSMLSAFPFELKGALAK